MNVLHWIGLPHGTTNDDVESAVPQQYVAAKGGNAQQGKQLYIPSSVPFCDTDSRHTHMDQDLTEVAEAVCECTKSCMAHAGERDV